MMRAVANRPAEAFATEVQTPDWQMEPDNGISMRPGRRGRRGGLFVDPDGNPVERPPPREDGRRACRGRQAARGRGRRATSGPTARPASARSPGPSAAAATQDRPRRSAAATLRLARPDPVQGGALALEPGARRRGIGAEQTLRPRRGNPGRGSGGRDARPRARPSPGGRIRARGSAASCSGSRRSTSSSPSARPDRRPRPVTP